MTVLVSVKINDGVVMAADSASSFASGMIYHHAQKIVNLRKGLPIGAMVTGAGGIGNESIDTLLKDLRRRFSGGSADHPDWSLTPDRYTLEQVAVRVREFLFEEKSRPLGGSVWTKVRLCGYSAGRPLAEVWEVQLMGLECAAPTRVQAEHEFGPRWDGEYEALDRLIFGLGTKFNEVYTKHGLSAEQAADVRAKLAPELYELLFLEAMPIHDAVDLARFLVQTTIGFVKFSVGRPKTVARSRLWRSRSTRASSGSSGGISSRRSTTRRIELGYGGTHLRRDSRMSAAARMRLRISIKGLPGDAGVLRARDGPALKKPHGCTADRASVPEPVLEFLALERRADDVALGAVAAKSPQRLQHRLVLNAFGGDTQPHDVREVDGGANNRRIVAVAH